MLDNAHTILAFQDKLYNGLTSAHCSKLVGKGGALIVCVDTHPLYTLILHTNMQDHHGVCFRQIYISAMVLYLLRMLFTTSVYVFM